MDLPRILHTIDTAPWWLIALCAAMGATLAVWNFLYLRDKGFLD